jgi:aminoglycoside phosphotransferase (APT) family kinase protein
VTDPGPLIARGRSADIFDVGDGRVLRRCRSGPVPDHEVAAMRIARAHGYPAPHVHSVDGADMVIDRVDGEDLLSQLRRRPWRARRIGALLAELHLDLARIPIDGVAIRTSHEPREALVHGDLHPGNVLAAASGPVVIDWEAAGAGPRDADVATTWLLLSVADADDVPALVGPLVGMIRSALLARFLALVPPPRPATIRAVCDERLADRNMREHERERIRRFRARHGGAG